MWPVRADVGGWCWVLVHGLVGAGGVSLLGLVRPVGAVRWWGVRGFALVSLVRVGVAGSRGALVGWR